MELLQQNLNEWVKSTNDHQFWSYHYMEHADMIHLILKSFKDEFDEHKRVALEWKELWKNIYEKLMLDNSMKIPNDYLEAFRKFKLTLLNELMKKEGWKGWAPLSLYEHMIREVEYLQKPKTGFSVMKFWLTDMEGHAALDADWTDPSEETLVKKAREIADGYSELRKPLGGDGKVNLLSRLNNESIPDDGFPQGNLKEFLNRMIVLQNNLTNYQSEYKNLAEAGKIFTNMTMDFINHTLRESMRASYELELLSLGKFI